MPAAQDDRALVLRLREVGESDLLIDLFGRDTGRFTALAKGAKRSRKRFFGLLLAGHLLETTVSPTKSPDLWRLDAAKLLDNHLPLRQDWRKWIFGAAILELPLRATAPHDPHPKAFDLTDRTLTLCGLAVDKKTMASRLLVFLTLLAAELGYGLSLEHCIRCGRPCADEADLAISPEGGVICRLCPRDGRARPLSPGLLKGLRAAMALPEDKKNRLVFPPALAREGLAFMQHFWLETTGVDLHGIAIAADAI